MVFRSENTLFKIFRHVAFVILYIYIYIYIHIYIYIYRVFMMKKNYIILKNIFDIFVFVNTNFFTIKTVLKI